MIVAISLRAPPQSGQVRTSTANTRRKSSAQRRRAAGTRCLTVWQPDVYHKLQTQEEATLAAHYPGQREFFLEVTKRIAADPELAADPDFLFLAELFRHDPRALFFDFCHVNEAANRSLAEALISPLQARLP